MKYFNALVIALLASFALVGCDTGEGPVEETEDVVQDTGESIENTGEEIGEESEEFYNETEEETGDLVGSAE